MSKKSKAESESSSAFDNLTKEQIEYLSEMTLEYFKFMFGQKDISELDNNNNNERIN